jgi:Coatomer WD associated region/WD domain, G-beta repeat
VWSIHANSPNYTLEGHAAGVCALAYYPGGDKPYLASGGDDKTVRVWDFQNKHCVATLTGHLNNVTSIAFHPQLPLLLSCGEDDTLRVWHLASFVQEKSFNLGMDRIWSVAISDSLASTSSSGPDVPQPIVAIGTDKGIVAAVLGAPAGPLLVIDNAGKALWLQDTQVFTGSLKQTAFALQDGGPFTLPGKEFGHVDISPTKLVLAPNGRFVALVGACEYIIYSSLAWRSRAFGDGSDFVWADDSQYYAVLQQSRVQLYAQFEPTFTLSGVTAIFSGPLLTGIQQDGYLCFWRWSDLALIRRMDVPSVRGIFWHTAGTHVAVATETDGVFILAYNAPTGGTPSEDGFEDAFQLVDSILEDVVSALWIQGCFVYTNKQGKLMYWCGPSSSSSEAGAALDELVLATVTGTLVHYQETTGMLFVATGKGAKLVAIALPKALIEAQLAIYAGTPLSLVLQDTLPLMTDSRDLLYFAKFLARQGCIREAIQVTPDFQHGFELACKLMDTALAFSMLRRKTADGSTHDLKKLWLSLADLALQEHNIPLLETCYQEAKQYTSLLILYSLQKDNAKLLSFATGKEAPGHVAFWAALLAKDSKVVQGLLKKNGKYPELALYARAEGLSLLPEDVKLAWKRQLNQLTSDNNIESDEGILYEEESQAVLDHFNYLSMKDSSVAVETLCRPSAPTLTMNLEDPTLSPSLDLLDADIPIMPPMTTIPTSPPNLATNIPAVVNEKKSSIQYKSPDLILSPTVAHSATSATTSPTALGTDGSHQQTWVSPLMENTTESESFTASAFSASNLHNYQEAFEVTEAYQQSSQVASNLTGSQLNPNAFDYQDASIVLPAASSFQYSNVYGLPNNRRASYQDPFDSLKQFPANEAVERTDEAIQESDDWADFQDQPHDDLPASNIMPVQSPLVSHYPSEPTPGNQTTDSYPASNAFFSFDTPISIPESSSKSGSVSNGFHQQPVLAPLNSKYKEFSTFAVEPSQAAQQMPVNTKPMTSAFKLGRPLASSVSTSTQSPQFMKSTSKED